MREQLTSSYSPVSTRSEPLLSSPNTIAVTPRAILQRPTPENPASSEFLVAPVTCIRSCKVSERSMEQACKIAAQNPAIRTIFQHALGEKRARVYKSDGKGSLSQRASKAPRRVLDVGESSSLRRSHRQTNNPLTHGRRTEHEPVVEIDVIESSTQEAEEDLIEAMEVTDHNQSVETDHAYQQIPSKNKGKEKVEAIPINWMKGELPFMIQDALSGPSPGLNITLPQLLDCSPRLRRDLAKLLRSSVPHVRKKRFSDANSKGQ